MHTRFSPVQLKDGLKLTYFWIKSQLEKDGGDASKYASSTIVQTSAPTVLGGLRAADGKEGF